MKDEVTECTIDSYIAMLTNLYPTIDLDFLYWLRSNGYFTAPASREYHGNYAGGLFIHSYAVAEQLKTLTERNGLKWENERSPIVVGLFHDICKIDQYRNKTEQLHTYEEILDIPITNEWEHRSDMLLKGHGDKSVMILASHMQLTEEEVMCIRYHMGVFTDEYKWTDYTRAVHKYSNVLWTHQADMIAAHILNT